MDTRKPKSAVSLGLGFLMASSFAANGAFAQEPAAEKEAPKGRQLEEVVVTAQKREQSIQDVPISVSSISGDSLKEMNIENMDDLSKITPNLKISTDGIYNTIAIRGLGSGTNNGFEQSVGVFVDDVYYTSTVRLLSAMYDIDRIEVLRGPQGTLFGRNTIAGAVAMHTAPVIDDYEFDLDATFGDRDWNKHSVVVNAPIIDGKLAARVAGQYFKRDGHVYDRLFETETGTTSSESIRAKLRYWFGEDADLTISAQYQESQIDGQGDQYHNVPDSWLPVFRAFDPETEGNLDDNEHSTNYLSGGVNEYIDLSAHLNFRAFEHDFVAIASYTESEKDGGLDVDFGPVPLSHALGGGHVDQLNMELRLVSDPGTIEYVAGLYYFWFERSDQTDVLLAPVIGTDTLSFILPEITDAVLAGLLPDQETFDAETRKSNFVQEGISYAAYGQATWNITESWSLIVGARYSADYKDFDFVADNVNATGIDTPFTLWGDALNNEEFAVKAGRKDAAFSPKVSLSHYLNDDISLYFTYAKGFKAGGFNGSAKRADEDVQFEPEEAVTYEAGIKGDYFGGAARLNIGLFRTEFDDLQVSTFDGLDYIVDNAATALSQGVEIEGMALLPWGFLLSGNYAYTEANYENFEFGSCQTQSRTENPQGPPDYCDLSGEPLAGAPKEQYSVALNYYNDLGDLPFGLVLGVDYYYQDGVFLQTDLDPEDFQEAYSLWNARLSLADDDENWTASVYVKNITDETVLVSSFDVPLFSGAHAGATEPPRTVTANFQLKY